MPVSNAEVDVAESIPFAGSSRALRAGFTLVDILVSIAVVGVLIAIMLPSLASVKETAHQIVCRSNVRQIGFAFDMYTEAHKGVIPSTLTIPSIQDLENESSYNTLMLRFAPGEQYAGGAYLLNLPRWDGLGILFEAQYLPVPKVFYCPSHKGENPYSRSVDRWRTEGQTVIGNFQYRGRGPTGATTPTGDPRMSNRLDLMIPSAALVADGLRTQADFNHLVGANMLRADLSVDWFQDRAGVVSDLLPKDDGTLSSHGIQTIWSQFDVP